MWLSVPAHTASRLLTLRSGKISARLCCLSDRLKCQEEGAFEALPGLAHKWDTAHGALLLAMLGGVVIRSQQLSHAAAMLSAREDLSENGW